MAITFIFGKPGGGKSLLAFRRIIDELMHGTRPIVTNLPVRLPELNEWLQNQGATIDLHRRLRLITAEDLAQWWRFRGRAPDSDGTLGDWVTLPPPDEKSRTSFVGNPGPVLYVLDEIHTAFNARAWMQTGLAATWYQSQHRKLGDDVLMISQTPAQVDKQLRSLSQEWLQVTNLGKLRFLQFFRMPRRMLWRAYANQPGPTEPILYSGVMRIADWANCYDTAAGNSIQGVHGADLNTAAKGLPWWLIVAVPLAIIFAITKVDDVIAGSFNYGVRRGQKPIPAASGPAEASAPSSPSPAPSPAAPPIPGPPSASPAMPEAPAPPPVTASAWWRIGRTVTVSLSDGSTLTCPGEIRTFSESDGVTTHDGRNFPWRPSAPRQAKSVRDF